MIVVGPLEKLREGIYRSLVQFRIPPSEIQFEKFTGTILGDPLMGDLVTRIIHESQKFEEYVAVSQIWLKEQLISAAESIKQERYDFKSPLARNMCGANPGQIFDSTIQQLNEKELVISAHNELGGGRFDVVSYLNTLGFGEWFRLKQYF